MALWAITLNIDVVMIEPIPQTSLSVSECIPPTHNKQLNRNVEHRRFENGRLHALNPFAEKQKKKKRGIQFDYWVFWVLVWTRSAAVEDIQVAVLAGTLSCCHVFIYTVAGPGLLEFQFGWRIRSICLYLYPDVLLFYR